MDLKVHLVVHVHEKDRINDKVFYNLYTDNKNCERVSKFILENL